LTSAGVEVDLSDQIDAILHDPKAREDPYVLALMSISLHNVGRISESLQLANHLVSFQDASGSVQGAETSITRSFGESLLIETTSLSIIAWTRHKEMLQKAAKATEWLAKQCEGGKYGSTQATILSLKALLAFDSVSPFKPTGLYEILVDDQVLDKIELKGEKVHDLNSKIRNDILTLALRSSKTGPHRIHLRSFDGSPLRFAIRVTFFSEEPPIYPDGKDRPTINIRSVLGLSSAREGSLVPLDISVENKAEKDTGMVLAIIDIPSGLEVNFDQLERLKTVHNLVSAFEVQSQGRQIVLYFVSLSPLRTVDIHLDLGATTPGSFSSSPSVVYEYYNDNLKNWAPSGLSFVVETE